VKTLVNVNGSDGEKDMMKFMDLLNNKEDYKKRLDDLKNARQELRDMLGMHTDVDKIKSAMREADRAKESAAEVLRTAEAQATKLMMDAHDGIKKDRDGLAKKELEQAQRATDLTAKEKLLVQQTSECEKAQKGAEYATALALKKMDDAVQMKKLAEEENRKNAEKASKLLALAKA